MQNNTRNILLPIDDSPTTQHTIEQMIASGPQSNGRITLIHVINNEQLAYRMIPDFQVNMVKENAKKTATMLLEKTATELEQVGFLCEKIVVSGDPRVELANYANDKPFDLVIIGRHTGGGALRNVLFGSVANYILHNVKCPVLLF